MKGKKGRVKGKTKTNEKSPRRKRIPLFVQ